MFTRATYIYTHYTNFMQLLPYYTYSSMNFFFWDFDEYQTVFQQDYSDSLPSFVTVFVLDFQSAVDDFFEDQTRTFNNMSPMNPQDPPNEADPAIPEMDNTVVNTPTEEGNTGSDSAGGVGCGQHNRIMSSSYILFLLVGVWMYRRSRYTHS